MPRFSALAKRPIVTLVDDDHHRMETFFGASDGEAKAMDISYSRKSWERC